MPAGTSTVQARITAWWLGGEEECPHCAQLYAYEIEFRCSECDRPSCPHCRQQHSEGHHICPTCVDSSEEHPHG